jgi:hypothetical protein
MPPNRPALDYHLLGHRHDLTNEMVDAYWSCQRNRPSGLRMAPTPGWQVDTSLFSSEYAAKTTDDFSELVGRQMEP